MRKKQHLVSGILKLRDDEGSQSGSKIFKFIYPQIFMIGMVESLNFEKGRWSDIL